MPMFIEATDSRVQCEWRDLNEWNCGQFESQTYLTCVWQITESRINAFG